MLIFQQPRDFPSVLFNFESHNYTFACISYTLQACKLHILFQIIRVTLFLKLTIHESSHYATSCIYLLSCFHTLCPVFFLMHSETGLLIWIEDPKFTNIKKWVKLEFISTRRRLVKPHVRDRIGTKQKVSCKLNLLLISNPE